MEILNNIFLPFRLLLSHQLLNKLGLRSLRDERNDMVLKYCRGKVLDIGCGNNQLIKEYNQKHNNDSVGVDSFDSGDGALIAKDVSKLPFPDNSFQTITFVASFQYVFGRRDVIKAIHRILDDDGVVLMTSLSHLPGRLRYLLTWWDEDQNKKGMKEDERYGLSCGEICSFMEEYFILVKRERFVLGLNNLYIFKKKLS